MRSTARQDEEELEQYTALKEVQKIDLWICENRNDSRKVWRWSQYEGT